MAKALLVKINTILSEKTCEEIRADILRQYHEGGVIVLDNRMEYEVVEFDSVEVNNGSEEVLKWVNLIQNRQRLL